MARVAPVAPRFAVTGTGRCGTGYTAAVLARCGIDCGHENWWTPDPARVRTGLDGDVSWLALPSIEAGDWSGPVAHIVRHPVDVVRSFVALDFPDHVSLPHEPDLADVDHPARAVEFWVRWNRRCAAVAGLTVRVEHLVDRLDDLAEVIGHQLDRQAAAGVPPAVNHRRRAAVDAGVVWRLLDGRAEPFGYHP